MSGRDRHRQAFLSQHRNENVAWKYTEFSTREPPRMCLCEMCVCVCVCVPPIIGLFFRSLFFQKRPITGGRSEDRGDACF
jgi:hypothetical protein